MLLCSGTPVAIRGVHDPYGGTLGRVIDEPSPMVRTVLLALGNGSTVKRRYTLGQIEAPSPCLGCGDALLEPARLCPGCLEPPAA